MTVDPAQLAISAAVHESGHVVVAARLGLQVRGCAINTDDGSGLTTTAIKTADADDPHWAVVQIIVSMSGAAAEVELLGAAREAAADEGDRANQHRYAQALAPLRQRDWEPRCWRNACAYVRQFADDIAALADELILARRLSGALLDRAVNRNHKAKEIEHVE